MKKKIPLMKPNIDKDEILAVKKVFESNFLTEGIQTRKFEKNFAKYVNSNFAIATTSGTSALHLAFSSLNIKGKKVLVSDFTFPATALAIKLTGGIPVLIDVDKDTMNTTHDIIDDSLSNDIEYLCPVSIFGNPLESKIFSLKRKGIKIIEDAATSLGSVNSKERVGNQADITCFSFHPRKIITTGEGGMISTNNKKLFQKMNSFKLFGKVNGKFVELGTNYKMSDIVSSIGITQLSKLKKILEKRQLLAKNYDELISKIDFLEPQKISKFSKSNYQSYVCKLTKSKKRDKLIKFLSSKNIETQIGTYALHDLPVFKNSMKKGSLLNSKYLFENTISLPMYHELTYKTQEHICKTISCFR